MIRKIEGIIHRAKPAFNGKTGVAQFYQFPTLVGSGHLAGFCGVPAKPTGRIVPLGLGKRRS